MRQPAEFKTVLQGSLRWRDEFFGVYAVPNPHAYGRLGIVVSRKTSPRAVVRNRVKRQIRESFRGRQENLAGLDFVVVASPRAGREQVATLRAALGKLWEKVEQRCKKS